MSLILGNGEVTFGDSTIQSTAAGLLTDGYRGFQVFRTFGIFTIPTDVTQIRVRVVGGGGAGAIKAGGSGGGGGGYACAEFKVNKSGQNDATKLNANEIIPVLVGVGGKAQFNLVAGAFQADVNADFSTYSDVLVPNPITDVDEAVDLYYAGTITTPTEGDGLASLGSTVATDTYGRVIQFIGNETTALTTFMANGSPSSFGTYLMAGGGGGGKLATPGTGGSASSLSTTVSKVTEIYTTGGNGGKGGGSKSGSGINAKYFGGGGGGSAGGIYRTGNNGGNGNWFGGGGGGGIGGIGANASPRIAAGGGGSYGSGYSSIGGINSLGLSNMIEYNLINEAFTPNIGAFPFQIFTGGGGFMDRTTPYNGGAGGGGCGGYIKATLDATSTFYQISYKETLVRSGSNGGIGGGGGGGSPKKLAKHFVEGNIRVRGYGGAGNGGIGGGGGGSCGDLDFSAGNGGNGIVIVEWK